MTSGVLIKANNLRGRGASRRGAQKRWRNKQFKIFSERR